MSRPILPRRWLTFATLRRRPPRDGACQVCRQPSADASCERCGGPIDFRCWQRTLPPAEARRWAGYVAALNAPRETVTFRARTRRGRGRRWRVPGDLPVDTVYFAIICPRCQS
jgi:predicted amidophosphoribosyltransferase